MSPSRHIAQALPLTHLSFHILLALARQDLHGYAVIKAVRESPGNPLNPGTGTFYSAIRRMLDEGLIVEANSPSDDTGDSRRRYYSISELGREILGAETRRLEEVVQFARTAVATAPGPVASKTLVVVRNLLDGHWEELSDVDGLAALSRASHSRRTAPTYHRTHTTDY